MRPDYHATALGTGAEEAEDGAAGFVWGLEEVAEPRVPRFYGHDYLKALITLHDVKFTNTKLLA